MLTTTNKRRKRHTRFRPLEPFEPRILFTTTIWTGNASGDPNNWDNTGNWTLGLPDSTKIAQFNGSANITLTNSEIVGVISVGGSGDVSIELGSQTLTANTKVFVDGNGRFIVHQDGSSTVNGTLTTSLIELGDTSGQTATLEVFGEHAHVNANGTIKLGLSGGAVGKIIVTGEATLTAGNVVSIGAGTSIVGFGSGIVTVDDDATMTASNTTISHGSTLTIGEGGEYTAPYLTVGDPFGGGNLHIYDAGTLTVSNTVSLFAGNVSDDDGDGLIAGDFVTSGTSGTFTTTGNLGETLVIDGDLDASAGVINITDIDDFPESTARVFTGDITLGGSITELHFTSEDGDYNNGDFKFAILVGTTVSATFSDYTLGAALTSFQTGQMGLPDLDAGYEWIIAKEAASINRTDPNDFTLGTGADFALVLQIGLVA